MQRPWSTHGARGETEAQGGPDSPWSHSRQYRLRSPHTHTPITLPSPGCLLPSAKASSRGWEPQVVWKHIPHCLGSHGWLPRPRPPTAEGCHPFSLHLICLKTMKKNHSHLSALAATVIYSFHQSPLPWLAPRFPPKRPKARVGDGATLSQLMGCTFRVRSGDDAPALSLWREGSVHITDHCCVTSGNSRHLSV